MSIKDRVTCLHIAFSSLLGVELGHGSCPVALSCQSFLMVDVFTSKQDETNVLQ